MRTANGNPMYYEDQIPADERLHTDAGLYYGSFSEASSNIGYSCRNRYICDRQKLCKSKSVLRCQPLVRRCGYAEFCIHSAFELNLMVKMIRGRFCFESQLRHDMLSKSNYDVHAFLRPYCYDTDAIVRCEKYSIE